MDGACVKPLLVLSWGNLSRGDDALGPLCVAGVQARLPAWVSEQIEFLDDYQLQVEYALDLAERRAVLFVDASLSARAPFEASPAHAQRDTSYSSHAVSAPSLLQVFEDLYARPAPAAMLLAIRGQSFELGEPLSAAAQQHLLAAQAWATTWLTQQATPVPHHA